MTLSILNGEIFSAEKQNQLCSMMNALKSVWDNASDEILPFICRKKVENVIVSVVIPVYNVEKYLTKALQSIVNQTLEDIEIICVDDGSTDRSLEILNFFAAHDERITVITQPNSNAGVARNRGINIAKGKYLYFMDSDDWIVPHMLEKAVRISEHENCDTVVWSYAQIENSTKKVMLEKIFNEEIIGTDKHYNLFMYLSPCAWNKLFRREIILNHNLRFQEISNNNDSTFTMCAVALSKRIKTIAEPMYIYRKHGSGLQASVASDPYCCVKARIHLQNELIRLGLLQQFNEPFVNAFYNIVGCQLALVPLSLEKLIEIRGILQKHFDCGDIQAEQVFDKESYNFVQSMFFSNENYYPTKLVTILKQYNGKAARFRKDNAALQAEVKKLTAANKKLKSSFSYRLGRVLTWLPRRIRQIFK